MTQFINKYKVHLGKIGAAIVGALIAWAFALGGIIHEHTVMAQQFPHIITEQQHLTMNDTLLSIRIDKVLDEQQKAAKEQRRSNKILYKIANKLHVEIPAE